MNIESRRFGEVEPALQAAEGFLRELTDEEKAPVLADIAKVRAEIAGMMSPEDERNLSAAKGKVRQARSQLESQQVLGIDDTLRTAEGFLATLAENHKAPVMAEIQAIREQVSAASSREVPAAAPIRAPVREMVAVREQAVTTAAPAASAGDTQAVAKPTPSNALSDEDASKLSRAKSRVNQAKELLDSRRTENIEYTLQTAEGLLEGIPDAATAALRTQMMAMRAKLADALASEDIRRIGEEITRHLSSAESSIRSHPRLSAEALERVAERLAADDVKRTFSAEAIEAYRARMVETGVRLAASNKADALDRALPILSELEERVASDPFVGLAQHEAYSATGTLQALKNRVLGAIRHIPEDDDTKAINARLIATDQKIDQASAAWGKAVLDATVGGGWSVIKTDIAGWQEETRGSDARPLEEPHLPKTRSAIQRIHYLLEDPETKRIRAENQGDATLEPMYREAEAIFEAAAAKLNAAFNAVLDEADKLETPMRRFDLDRPNMLAVGAEYSFKGTRYLEANIARARALDQRWKSEVAAIMKTRQDLYDRLAGEADAAWPAIVEAIGARDGFDPTDPSWRGKTVLLAGVYNRSGWDFGGRDYDFAMRFDGMPLGGNYEPHVLEALEHAWYHLKLDVNDRITWDLVGVVEGPGKIGERTTIILKNRDTNLEIGKMEEYRPVDCVRIKIIALHAGPVAVGPRA